MRLYVNYFYVVLQNPALIKNVHTAHMRVMDFINGQVVRLSLALNEDQYVSLIQIILFELPTRTLRFFIGNFQLTFSLSVSVNSVYYSQPSPIYFNFISILISFLLQT